MKNIARIEVSTKNPRSIYFWTVAIGIAGGATGVAYLACLHELTHLLGPEHWSPYYHLIILTAVGLAIGFVIKWLGNPGDVELMVNNIHMFGGHDEMKQLKSLIPSSLLCIAAGGPAGPEAPMVQTTGSLGTWIAQRGHFDKENIRILTITGMAAGFTVLFGAPLGAAVFALEILHRQGLEYFEALLPAVVGSICGYAFFTLATGLDLAPVWTFPSAGVMKNIDLGWSVLVGIASVPLVFSFTYGHIYTRKILSRIPSIIRPMLGGALLGLIALLSPYALTFGEIQIGNLAMVQGTVVFWAGILAAKFSANIISLCSGWRGGFIIPLFFMGLCLAKIFHVWFPSSNEVVLMAGFMAAVNTGVTKTPLGSTLVITEMTGIQLLPTTLIACIIVMLLTSQAGLIHSQQERQSTTG